MTSLVLLSWDGFAAVQLSFIEALKRMQENHFDIQLQKTQVRKAEAQLLYSQSDFFPTFEAKIDEQQNHLPSFSESSLLAIAGKVNLFRFGADEAKKKASQLELNRARFFLQQTQLEAEKLNTLLLIQYIEAFLKKEVTQHMLKLSEELAAIEEARYRRGLISQQEVQRSKIERNNSLAKAKDADANVREVRIKISVQMGGDVFVQPIWPWKTALNMLEEKDFQSFSFNFQQSPKWKIAQETILIEKEKLNSQFRQFFPSLDLQVSYGLLNYRQSGTNSDRQLQTILSLSVPLFDLRRHASYRLQQEEKSFAQIAAEKVKREIESQWQLTQENFTLAVQSAQEREKSMDMAKTLYQDNKRRLQAGRSSMNDVLVDQNRLAEAELLTIHGWAQAHLLYSDYCYQRGEKVKIKNFGCEIRD